jgi:hypothetical protein
MSEIERNKQHGIEIFVRLRKNNFKFLQEEKRVIQKAFEINSQNELIKKIKKSTVVKIDHKEQNKLLKTDAIKINAWLGTLNTKEVSEDLFTHADENEAINKLNEFVDSFKNSLNEVKALKDSNIILNKLVDGLKKEIYQLNAGITELENKNDILSKMVDELKEELTIEKEKVSSMLINSETELVSEVESNDDTFHFFKRFLPKK